MLVVHSCRTDDYYYQQTDSENQFQNRKFYVLSAKEVKAIPGLWGKVQTVQQNSMVHNSEIQTVSRINQDSLLQGGIIEADSVLVIENNGSKTYTFKIARAVSSSTVENLVLKKNADESFSGVMLKYNFTAQEKQISSLGHSVDYTNKIEVFPIENLNIAARVVSQTSGCYTVTWETGICKVEGHSYLQDCNAIGNDRAGIPQIISVQNKCVGAAVNDIGVDNDDNPSGGGGFDTGPWGAGSGEDGEPITANACEELELRNLLLKTYFGNPKFQGRLTEISENIATNPYEKSFSFGISSGMGKFEAVTPIKVGTKDDVGFYASYTNMIVYGVVHTHPKNAGNKAFSGADFFSFAGANKANPALKYYLVKSADGSVYALSITDQWAFSSFFENKTMSDYTNSEREFKIESDIGGYIYTVKSDLAKKGKSKQESYELALAFVLKKYNMGLGLSKMDSNGDFKPLFVNETTPNPQKPKKKNYEKTDNCNL